MMAIFFLAVFIPLKAVIFSCLSLKASSCLFLANKARDS
jgi:hypothetical protein